MLVTNMISECHTSKQLTIKNGSAVRAAAARGCVLAFAGWWVALATPAQLALFHNFCLCLGLTAEMRRVDNNVKAVIRARARKVSRGAAVD